MMRFTIGLQLQSLKNCQTSAVSIPGADGWCALLRVRTIYASAAGAAAEYYARYLTDAPGEVPGVWSGWQADALGLDGVVDVDGLRALLEGHDPVTGARLGRPLVERPLADGRVVRAVAGFDATFRRRIR